MKRTLAIFLVIILTIFSFSAYAEDEEFYAVTEEAGYQYSISDILPSSDDWGLSVEVFQKTHSDSFEITKVKESEALTLTGLTIESYPMDVYYVFGDGVLSKITYILNSSIIDEPIDIKECTNELEKHMEDALGKASSTGKGVTEWVKDDYIAQIGTAKLKNYTGSDDLAVCVIFKTNGNAIIAEDSKSTAQESKDSTTSNPKEITSITVSESSPFHEANYDDYNSYARDNGLKGDTIHLCGTIIKFDETQNGIPFFYLEQEDGKQWIVSYLSVNLNSLLNKKVEVYCVYGGFSDNYHLPTVHADVHGCVYDIEKDEYYFSDIAKLSMEEDGFIVNDSSSGNGKENVFGSDDDSIDTFTVCNMTYSIPSTWITEASDNGYYHFGKQSGSTDGGYLYSAGYETDPDLAKKLNASTAHEFMVSFFSGIFVFEGDLELIEAGDESHWSAYYSGAIKNGYYANCWYCIDANYHYGLTYVNTGVGRTDQDDEFLEIIKSIKISENGKIEGDKSTEHRNTISSETTPNPDLSEVPTNKAGSSILFRNIPWFEQEMTVRENLEKKEGLKPIELKQNTRIESWFHETVNMWPEFDVEEAGVTLEYYNVSVAGYKARLKLYFAYPIQSGLINYETDSAQFYMAEYLIKDLEDTQSAYDSLVGKLSQLYGSPQEKSYYSEFAGPDPHPKGSLWVAPDDSLVWLALDTGYSSTDHKQIYIFYAAPHTNEYLKQLDAQIKKEASDNEAAEREQNSTNYDGL